MATGTSKATKGGRRLTERDLLWFYSVGARDMSDLGRYEEFRWSTFGSPFPGFVAAAGSNASMWAYVDPFLWGGKHGVPIAHLRDTDFIGLISKKFARQLTALVEVRFLKPGPEKTAISELILSAVRDLSRQEQRNEAWPQILTELDTRLTGCWESCAAPKEGVIAGLLDTRSTFEPTPMQPEAHGFQAVGARMATRVANYRLR